MSPPLGPQSVGGAGSAQILSASARFELKRTGVVEYVSEFPGDLIEFDYPKSESPIGQITGLSSPGGPCTKGSHTFWVSTGASSPSEIEEFAVGGRKPIKTLHPGGNCAVDPATGDLAVLAGSGVVIFKGGSGSGKTFSTVLGYFDGYDNRSDLFVDGFTSGNSVGLAELPKGGSKFQTITTSNSVQFPGSVQWDGTYLTVFDQAASAFYQYTVRGTKATLKGTVSLSGASDCGQTSIARPYAYCVDVGSNDVTVYKYPAGGSSVATLSGVNVADGVVALRAR
jgi:hypothetical protein